MATRKRVFALCRAPDGSAFQKCDLCGVSVAIAIKDMHQCKVKKRVKNRSLKWEENSQNPKTPSVCDLQPRSLKWEEDIQNPEKPICDLQPRSPFRIFMESFKKANQNDDWIDVDRRGFETWKCMPVEEKHCFSILAEKVNSVYDQILLEEAKNEDWMEDDEADSACVGKIDLRYYGDAFDDWEDSESFEYVSDH